MTLKVVPLIAVVIPHYNDTRRLLRCLLALERQEHHDIEVVVSDNSSTQPLYEVQTRVPWVRFVTQPAKGAGPARNLGIESTTAPYLLLLDADCVPAPNWLETARSLTHEASRDIIGGRLTVFDETPPPRSGAEAFETIFAFNQEAYINQKGFSVTANLMLPRSIFEAVGPFAADVSEDFEWCHRATAAGFRLRYAPELIVSHPTRATWCELRKKWLRLTQESYGLVPAKSFAKCLWALRALAMPFSVLLHLPKVITHPQLSPIERMRAAGILTRLRFARMTWMLSIMMRGDR